MFNKTKGSILIADDEEKNRKLIEFLLTSEGYTTLAAANGKEAVTVAEQNYPDLIVLDIMMPVMDGYEAAKILKQHSRLKVIPIIFLTALDDRASRLRALEAGGEDFLNKPIDRAELSVRVKNLIRLKEYGDLLSNQNRSLNEQVREKTLKLRDSYLEAVLTLVKAAEYKDEETGGHVQRISLYCADLAEALGMDTDFLDRIKIASPMHDVGKIAIPDSILLKPSAFSEKEWKIMKSHAKLGWQLLSACQSPYLVMGAEIALGHHERWDGSGYPDGLKGNAIPLSARIMSICDQYDALRSVRPYKVALSHDAVCDIILKGDGRTMPGHFDPAIFCAFQRRMSAFQDIFEHFEGHTARTESTG